jgi:hypothetical protein
MENVSKHISYAEATTTSTGVDNTPRPKHMIALKAVAENIFEPLREGLGGDPIRINSMYRSVAVNKAIGGAHRMVGGKYVATSQHCKGEAMDLDALKCTNAELFFYILDNLPFDQLIWEKGDRTNPDWVHCSYVESGRRGQVLVFDGKKYTHYEDGMVDRPAKKKPAAAKSTAKKPAAKKKVGRPKKKSE